MVNNSPLVRLNKYLAARGVDSRRHLDAIIFAGRVQVNGQKAVLGQKIDPDKDIILLDGRPLAAYTEKFTYYALNKPRAVLSTVSDDRGRPTVVDLLPKDIRIYPVGRLDYDSSGLILLTNDGDLTLKLTHPRYHLPKTYQVTLLNPVFDRQINQLERGVRIDDGSLVNCDIDNFHKNKRFTSINMTIYQGKNRQIRRMCTAVGANLVSLHRIAIGPVLIGKLKEGEYRNLTKNELEKLRKK